MPAITMLIGVMMLLLGIGGYGWGVIDASRNGGYASPTALIPSVIGLIFIVLGGIATSEKWRKHMMHAAVGVALVGFLAVASTLGIRNYSNIGKLLSGEKITNPIAVGSQIFTAVLCLVLVVAGGSSFVQARRRRLRGV